jgi:hypothetical protein
MSDRHVSTRSGVEKDFRVSLETCASAGATANASAVTKVQPIYWSARCRGIVLSPYVWQVSQPGVDVADLFCNRNKLTNNFTTGKKEDCVKGYIGSSGDTLNAAANRVTDPLLLTQGDSK